MKTCINSISISPVDYILTVKSYRNIFITVAHAYVFNRRNTFLLSASD